jgi:hypothetical protein
MTPKLIERIKRDFENEPRHSDWDSYLMGYLACLKRFGGKRESKRETKSQLGYSRIGLGNV